MNYLNDTTKEDSAFLQYKINALNIILIKNEVGQLTDRETLGLLRNSIESTTWVIKNKINKGVI